MELITKELEKRFKEIGSQEETPIENKIVVAKYFNAAGAGTWYATEYDPSTKTFFGYVSIFGDWNDEWGYFSLDELKSVKGFAGLGVERDLYCGEKTIKEWDIASLKN